MPTGTVGQESKCGHKQKRQASTGTHIAMGLGKLISGLFGGGASAPRSPAAQAVEHKGFTILPTVRNADGQWQIAGVISKEIDGERREQTFIRADKCASADEAIDMTVRKGRQLVDEQGERLFSR